MTDYPRDRIAKSLQSLKWIEMTEGAGFDDGQIILAAVRVRTHSEKPERGWKYVYSVVEIACDVHYLQLSCSGEPWGWEIDNIDLYVDVK